MLIAGVEVQNEQLFKELDSFFFKRYKSRFDTQKFMCTLCNVEHHKCYTLQHFQTCQRHMTNKFIVTLKTYVQLIISYIYLFTIFFDERKLIFIFSLAEKKTY